MTVTAPAIFWFKNDLRLQDNPGLTAACDSGKPVIPVYILDDESPLHWKRGGASRWWLHHSLAALSADIEKAGLHPLVLLHGDAKKEIMSICEKTGADAVFWNRSYEPWAMQRDKSIKEQLKQEEIEATSFGGFLLWEPWEIANKTGQPYKVFTPFSRACLERGGIRPPLTKKIKAPVPEKQVKGLSLKSLGLLPEIKWYQTMAKEWQPGEAGGRARLKEFSGDGLHDYKSKRDYPAVDGSSRLSPYLHFGELSPHTIWHHVSDVMAKSGNATLENNGQGYLRQLIWREFSWHLLYHFPTFPEKSWNPQFEKFEWQKNPAMLKKWQRGLTGYPIIDAGMRQLWQTGWMHNRVRMLVGSFLVKNLLLDWREGEDWFWDTLVDADLGNNAQGWQWIAGCGADAAPYFRIFNPILQSRKFDADGGYIRKYVPEIAKLPDEFLHAPWEAPALVLAAAGVTLGKSYPRPIVDHATARDRALEAYRDSKPA